jgi:hypothetical protein
MPILLVANASEDTHVEELLSPLNAWSSRRCSIYVRYKEGNHKLRSVALPFLVCDIEGLPPHFREITSLESDNAVIVPDCTAPDVEEIILEGGCNLDSMTYLHHMAELLEALRSSTDKQQNRRRAESALQIVQACIARRDAQGIWE